MRLSDYILSVPKGQERKAQCVFRQPHGDIPCTLGVHWNTLIWMSAFTPP